MPGARRVRVRGLEVHPAARLPLERLRLGTRHALAQCPACGKSYDAVTCATERGALPKEGDVAVCASCGEAAAYGPGGAGLRPLSADEWAALRDDFAETLVRVRATFRRRR